VVLKVSDLDAFGDRGLLALKDVSFEIRAGECVGFAGVSGNGQCELAEVISGLRLASAGSVHIGNADMTNRSPAEIIRAGLGYIPEERHRVGSIGDFTVAENAILETHQSRFTDGIFMNWSAIRQHVSNLISNYDVKTPSSETPARNLSGGNLQKLILGRELSRQPDLLLAAQPTRGLDVGATEYIRQELLKARSQGTAILLISEDLDEILSLSDRILVMYEGQIAGELSSEEADIETLGLMMGGAKV
jgi:ABC-type uncharacterized transport system ATPase subunit